MKKLGALLAAAAVVAILSGCLQVDTKVRVNRDGSGTIERNFVMRADFIEMIKSMSALDKSSEKKEEGGFKVMDLAAIKKEAAEMGEGVEFKSATPIKNKVGEGYKAVFAFKDINKLKMNQNPGQSVPTPGAQEGAAAEEKQFVTFEFTPGATANLIIRMSHKPEPEKKEEGKAEAAEKGKKDDEAPPEMLEQIYRDMKMSLVMEFQGRIVETNADHVAGNTVSLMDIDFSLLMKDKAALDTLTKQKVDSLDQLKAFQAKYKGLKMETKEELKVSFR